MKRIEDLAEFESPPEMDYRPLGRSGVNVSAVGFGTWSIGGVKWGPVDPDTALSALHRALDKGITFFDTSSVYGRGRSEKLLGKVAEERREDMVIATKGGIRIRSDGSLCCDTRPAALQEDLDRSRERLQTDTIDLYQIQWPPENGLSAGALAKLESFLDGGAARALGVCHFPVPMLERIRAHLRLDTVQIRFNLLEPDRFDEVRTYCIENGIDVLSCTSLAKGILTGKYREVPDFSEQDNRSGDPLFEEDRFRSHLETVEDLIDLAGELKKPASGAALNWTVKQEGITSALAGMKTDDQVDQNAHGAGWDLPDEFEERFPFAGESGS